MNNHFEMEIHLAKTIAGNKPQKGQQLIVVSMLFSTIIALILYFKTTLTEFGAIGVGVVLFISSACVLLKIRKRTEKVELANLALIRAEQLQKHRDETTTN